jgi:hypothetical protein
LREAVHETEAAIVEGLKENGERLKNGNQRRK